MLDKIIDKCEKIVSNDKLMLAFSLALVLYFVIRVMI